MRTLKFRAWNSQTGKMIDLQAITPLAMDAKLLELGAKGLFIPFDEHMILVQFTGLTDKNNAEVYEDDIVRNNDGDIYAIRWDRHLARFAFYWHNASKKGSNKEWRNAEETITDFDMKARFELIGNVDENPELLEEKQ